MALPMTVDDISAPWLQEALSRTWPDVRIDSICCDMLNKTAQTSSKIFVSVNYAPGSPTDLPRTLVIKTGFEEHHDLCMPFYSVEVDFYRRVKAVLPVNAPTTYLAEVQETPPQATIVMTDLAREGFEFGNPLKPFSADQSAAALEQLAIIHAQRTDSEPFSTVGSLQGPPQISGMLANDAASLFRESRGYVAPMVLHDADRIQKALAAYWAMIDRLAPCMVHGDAHIGNTYFDDKGNMGFLDWQGFGMASWVHDISYFVVGAMDLPERRHAERDLIQHYVEKRRQLGAPLANSGEVWDDYRRGVLYGFVMWLGARETWQPPTISVAQFARFAAAMIDHDSLGALGV
jgi:aminoglycoside phosphotransferase (APT) family kinase protein